MIANNQPAKWEYKVVNIQAARKPTATEIDQAAKVNEILNTDGQGNWELISTISQADNILPEGFVVLKRPYQAPQVTPRRFGALLPKPVAKTVAPAPAKPIVAAALSPTAGKTDGKA